MGSKSAFERAMNFVLPHECAYDRHGDVTWENVDGDAGGVTKWGIDQRSHPRIDIKKLTLSDATGIYYNEYWSPMFCTRLPEPLAIAVFDVAVNNGLHQAALLLQRALGVVADGFIGPKTLAAADKSGDRELRKLLSLRESLYRHLAKKPANRKFLKGWLARNADLQREVIESS